MRASRFLECLRAQLEGNRRIFALAQEEGREVDRRNVQGIVEIHRHREEIFFELASLQEEVTQLYSRLKPDEREVVRERLKEVRKEIESVVQEVLMLDAGNAKKVEQMRDAILEELKGLHESKQALLAYKPVSDFSPRFFDGKV